MVGSLMLFVDVKINESLQVGDVVLKLLQKSGQRVRFEVEAPRAIEVKRLTPITNPVNKVI
jgi:sRNA-binding carbon storage regulator CsrA